MRVIITYSTYPEPDTNAGGYRLVEIIKILRAAGHAITLLAQRSNAPRYREALQVLGVDCVCYHYGEVAENVLPFRRFLEGGRSQCHLRSLG